MYTGGGVCTLGGGVCTLGEECVHWGEECVHWGRSVYTGGGVCTLGEECVHWRWSVYTGGRSVYTGGKKQSSLWALTQAHYVCMERILYKYVCMPQWTRCAVVIQGNTFCLPVGIRVRTRVCEHQC